MVMDTTMSVVNEFHRRLPFSVAGSMASQSSHTLLKLIPPWLLDLVTVPVHPGRPPWRCVSETGSSVQDHTTIKRYRKLAVKRTAPQMGYTREDSLSLSLCAFCFTQPLFSFLFSSPLQLPVWHRPVCSACRDEPEKTRLPITHSLSVFDALESIFTPFKPVLCVELTL